MEIEAGGAAQPFKRRLFLFVFFTLNGSSYPGDGGWGRVQHGTGLAVDQTQFHEPTHGLGEALWVRTGVTVITWTHNNCTQVYILSICTLFHYTLLLSYIPEIVLFTALHLTDCLSFFSDQFSSNVVNWKFVMVPLCVLYELLKLNKLF